MKTGIVTFHNAINYGALLQTYALQTQLEKLECTTQVINYDNPYISSPMKKPNLHEYHNPLNYIRDKKIYGYNMVRSKKLTDFRQHYINLTNKISKEELPLLGELYDLVFTGSDQVWNDKITRNDSTYYLDFVPPYKRSSYAASIGSETIPLERTSHVYNYLKEFKAISVRETSAQKALLGQMGIQAERVLDPTLLLTENDYEKFIINGGTTEKYILVYMLLFSESLLKSAEKLSKKYNLPIKCINASGKIVKIGKDCSEAGIEEWLTLIKRAEYVLTNSFHGVAFSINFNKKFYVELPPTRVNANSRITDILNILDLDNRIIRNQELEESEINYTQVNSIIYSERIKSIQYIKNVLVSKEQNRNKDVSNSIINIEKKYCCGCALCEKVCPADAIKMETDEKGFSYPVMNAEKCINCGKCLKNCGYNQYRYKEHKKMPVNVYAAYSKNEEMVKNSSSGGIFFEIANYVLARNGIVYGAGFTKDFTLEHKDIDSIEDIRPLMGSKYVQSNISTVYEKIARQLKEGKEVLFVGTPCQCVAIKNYCKKYSSNLYIVDFVCHGVPSQRLLKDHIKFVEKKFNKQVKCYIPRTKVAGWGGNYELFEFSGGRKDYTHPITQAYRELFNGGLVLRDSCYNCPFTNFDRPGDITVSDYWGLKESNPELYRTEGISMVFPNTNKGKSLLDSLDTLQITETKIDPILETKQPHLYRSVYKKEDEIKCFWAEYQNRGYEFVANKYAGCNNKALIKRRIKKSIIYRKIRGYK